MTEKQTWEWFSEVFFLTQGYVSSLLKPLAFKNFSMNVYSVLMWQYRTKKLRPLYPRFHKVIATTIKKISNFVRVPKRKAHKSYMNYDFKPKYSNFWGIADFNITALSVASDERSKMTFWRNIGDFFLLFSNENCWQNRICVFKQF